MGLFKRKNNEKGTAEPAGPVQEQVNSADDSQHINDISNRFILGTDWSDNDVFALPIQDICVLIKNATWAQEKQIFADTDGKMEGKINTFYKILVEKMITSDILYTIIDEVTGYPFIDENTQNCIWLFSRKEYADHAADYFGQQYRRFRIEEVKSGERKEFLGEMFYMIGAAGVYMDNGLAGCMIKREDILKAPDWTGIPGISVPVLNPDFMLARLKMAQELGWQVQYENREQKLDSLETELGSQSIHARFLVPVKGMPQQKETVSTLTLEKDTKISFPLLQGKDGSSAIPVFADWKQFRMCYSDKEYGGLILSFDDLAAMVMQGKGHDAFVINPGKCPLAVNAKSMERMRAVVASAGEHKA